MVTYTPWPYRRREQHTIFAIDERASRIDGISSDNQTWAAMSSQNSTNGIKMGLLYAMCTGLFGGSIFLFLRAKFGKWLRFLT